MKESSATIASPVAPGMPAPPWPRTSIDTISASAALEVTTMSAQRRRYRRALGLLLAIILGVPAGLMSASSAAAANPGGDPAIMRLVGGSELSESTRLADRRTVVLGDRFYAMGTADGRYPATGWHTLGEMGGFWSQPIKLLDGLWFGVDGQWLRPATKTVSGWGYVRTEFPAIAGVRTERIDFVPDGIRAGLIGITLTPSRTRQASVMVDAHSELMSVYPWGGTNPSQSVANLPDTGSYDGQSLVFQDIGTPPHPNAAPHDWAAVVAGDRTPASGTVGPDHRGPQDPAVICDPDDAEQLVCDDSTFGRGTGGQLRYNVQLRAGKPTTLWFAVAGSDQGLAEARAEQAKALRDPLTLLAAKTAARNEVADWSQVDIPGDPLLQRSVTWSKQNLADSVQQSENLRLRSTNAGTQYPPSVGTVDSVRWLGAGWPDYPWLFGTDGEYTAFASVASGQFEPIKAHLRALRDVSEIINDRSGKVVHEVMPDGSVYFGSNDDPGNTDETSKFPSAVALVWRWSGDDAFRDDLYDFAVRNMRYVVDQLDADNDGWPEGLGNVERPGMGEEKLDNAVYTIRGLRDLADLAASKGDSSTAQWAGTRAAAMESAFENAWWFGRSSDQYADSLDDPGNVKVFQRHWIGLTPLDAVLVRPGQSARPLASDEHAELVLNRRQEACYSGQFGLYHTGTGPTTAPSGNPGPSCDQEVSTVGSERSVFSLNTAIMAVAEGNYGRLGPDQQRRYTTGNARIQLDPRVWEMPGAMPEIAPSEDFGANIDKRMTERSMVLQAWGAYGVLWPVVSQQLGISPDMGRSRISVIPQIPDGQSRIAGRQVRLGPGSIDVAASRHGPLYSTVVTRHVNAALTLGAVIADGASVRDVRVNGKPVDYDVRSTARGLEVVTSLPAGSGTHWLTVVTR